jgi:hypothetical protein
MQRGSLAAASQRIVSPFPAAVAKNLPVGETVTLWHPSRILSLSMLVVGLKADHPPVYGVERGVLLPRWIPLDMRQCSDALATGPVHDVDLLP